MDAIPITLRTRAQRTISLAETAFAYIGITFYNQGLTAWIRALRGGDRGHVGEADITSSITQAILILVMAVLLFARRRDYAGIHRYVVPYIVVAALCAGSALWSEEPASTLRRSVSLISCIVFGIYLAKTFGFDRVLDMVGANAVFLGIASVVVFFAIPSLGHEQAEGYENAMRGVFSQKNSMGECMVIGASCIGYRIIREGRLRLANVLGLALMYGCLLLGRTATSVVSISSGLIVAYYFYNRRSTAMRLLATVAMLLLLVSLLIVLVVSPELIANVTGRDASLTGRIPLWTELIGQVRLHPWLGHGFGGFWTEDSVTVRYIWYLIQWQPPDAHNGYMDVLLQIGAAGLAAYGWIWYRVLSVGGRAIRAGTLPSARWMMIFMMINLITNIDEGPLPSPDIFTLLMAGVIFVLGVWAEQERVGMLVRRWQPAAPLRQRLSAPPSGLPAWRKG